MINQDVFAFANTEDYLRLTRILDQNNDDPSRFFATLPSLSNPALTPAEKQEIMRAAGLSPDAVTRMITSATIAGIISKMAVTNPLGTQYFGAAPFLFGPERVMKFSAVPCQIVPPTDIPQPPGYDYLRQVLTQTMQQQGDLQFDFMVQVRPGGDGVELGIEDASSTWGQSFEPVAKISIHRPQPDVDSDAHKAQCENLSFSPWHSLVAHQPIGSINRLRKAVYEASSDRRHRR